MSNAKKYWSGQTCPQSATYGQYHDTNGAYAGGQHAAQLGLVVDDDDEPRHQPVEARIAAPGQQAQRIANETRIGNE